MLGGGCAGGGGWSLGRSGARRRGSTGCRFGLWRHMTLLCSCVPLLFKPVLHQDYHRVRHVRSRPKLPLPLLPPLLPPPLPPPLPLAPRAVVNGLQPQVCHVIDRSRMGGTPKELNGRSLVWISVRKENHHADAVCAILPTAFPYRKVGECAPAAARRRAA